MTGNTPCCGGNGKIIKIPQATNKLLDASKTYAVCYTAIGGTTSDNWSDSQIRVRVSKLRVITSYGVNHKTQGSIPNHAVLTVRYGGTLLHDRWISFVDATINSNNPCADGRYAAAPKDAHF